MEGVHLKRNWLTVRTQPLMREAVVGYQRTSPYTATVTCPDNDDTAISIQKPDFWKQVSYEGDCNLGKSTPATVSDASAISLVSEDDVSMVVDMGHGAAAQSSPEAENFVTNVRHAEVSPEDCNIVWRNKSRILTNDTTDLMTINEYDEVEEKGGCVVCGDETDIRCLMDEQPSPFQPQDKGVICNSEVLCSESGNYEKGKQYDVFPDTESKGAYGEAAMCLDVNTKKTFIRKKVNGPLSKNEVLVPLLFKELPGIPDVYGVIKKGKTTEIFQEDAGLSLMKLCNSEYAARFRDPTTLLGLAFQGFATLDKLHAKGIQHLDIKPENICVDMGQKAPRLKFIDFGTSQMPGEMVMEGLTNEYLSPESCRSIIKVATGQLKDARLESGTDVWALALSLLYCLCGYHVMVYLCTGDVMYRDTNQEVLKAKRIKCLIEVEKLTDADIQSRLIRPEWPDALKKLLINTLRVDPQQRWSARQAAYFILKDLLPQKPSTPQVVVPSSRPVLAPSALMVRVQNNQNGRQSVPVQWTSQATPTTELPVFVDLLPNDKTESRPAKRRFHDQPCRQGFKVMKK